MAHAFGLFSNSFQPTNEIRTARTRVRLHRTPQGETRP
jgi:hypothetical protein